MKPLTVKNKTFKKLSKAIPSIKSHSFKICNGWIVHLANTTYDFIKYNAKSEKQTLDSWLYNLLKTKN